MKIEEPYSNDWVRKFALAMNEISEGECGIGYTINSERDYVSTLRCKLCRRGEFRVKMSVESPKDFTFLSEIMKDFGYKLGRIYPDLILHENHNGKDLSPNNQHLVCEVKTAKYVDQNSFDKDLIKLNYCVEYLNYRDAAYILVNSSEETVNKRLNRYGELKNYFSHKVKKGSCKIYFLIQSKLGDNVEIYSIDFN